MSLLPTPYEFEKQYEDDEELATELPDRPITSLRDLQYLYGRLYTLATAGGGEYASYLTPEKSTDLFDEPESLAVLRVDLSGDEPRLDPEQPVQFRTYTRDLVEPVAHSWFNAARGFDHSITHRTGKGKDPEKIAEYLTERLTAWAADDVIQETVTDHEDGWIVEALAELGEQEDIDDRIQGAVEERLEGSTTALTTVAVKLEPDGEYRLPGACGSDVFNVAMRARKRSKLVSKGEATNSAGQATDLVTGSRGRTVGTAEDPLNYFLGKQLEKFPGFDPNEAWRTHPISEDVAVTLMNASTFVDACSYYTLESNVYYLPYFFGRITPEEARELYRMLHDVVVEDDLTPVEKVYKAYNRDEIHEELATRMRFYVAAVLKHQMKRFDVFGDTLDCTLFHPVGLASAHDAVTNSWVFDADATLPHSDVRPAMPTHENWEMLVADEEYLLGSITNGWYFRTTFAEPDDDQTASADDFRIQALVAALSGDPIPASTVLEEYVERLLDDEGEGFPTFRVATQYAQLCALAEAGLLDGEDESLTKATTYTDQSMTHTTDTRARADGGSDREKREAKLELFLEETPALSSENPERRGGFLLGVLVGQVTGYQQVSEGRSTTLVDQYPIKAITDTKVKRLTSDVIDKDVIYSRDKGLPSTMYGEVVDRIVETLPKVDADGGWSIDTSELRYYYALGVAYGMNNWTTSDEPTEDNEATESAEATDD
ncbi:type I-B CRISPR-associated protein Cas8b/Csh1 [Halalkalicoccus sp. NIPERK01]|uniref:type I-B CRISPR-associated protein Cas8b/Csh1 n=1 Tax=Halalkalicoccus sp. NIPERK01 TaxID=3053469 RepID=UPI00256EAEC8|nr:type I-B CRISPR-associated protein Cas8b/Csh1 [Halalkalicoccus sp. NIPERK01]MDL5360924.1 type I-B CRISPR-associated protein Cas8b/Csh1 [Halalkalicoccus sp. NIPERK01]